jgi:hypothetical protein
MARHLPRPLAWLLSFALIATLTFTPNASRPALADTATPVVSDSNVEQWSVGSGLIYWAENCFADEFNPFAKLQRRPVAGGPQRIIESINDAARCNTHLAMHSAADGLYYFDESQSRIARIPPGEPYTPQAVRTLANNQFPNLRRPLIEAGDHLYWLSSFGAIYRTRKDGGGTLETVATTGPSPADMLVVGGIAYWSDSTGIWSISLTCAALPCTNSIRQFSNISQGAQAYGLLYQSLGGFQGNYRIYWVEQSGSGATTAYRIHYRGCNQITVCYLQPPQGQLPDPPPLFYAATLNWQIGSPVLAGGNLFWSEIDRNTVNNTNGDVKRKSSNSSTPGADTIATSQAQIDDQLYVANDNLFFARRNAGIFSLPLTASAIARAFRAEGLEVTQAIQNLANNAPLVADKLTYVRAYATQISGPSTPNVEAHLVGTRNGVPLPGSPLQPVHGVRALTSGGSFDRARLNDGWYFRLPENWIAAGTITLQVVVDPRRIHTDPDRNDNQISQIVSFQSVPPVCVWTVPVRTHSPLPSVNDPNFWPMIDQFERRWPTPDVWVFRDTDPVEELEICTYYGIPYPCHGPYELDDGWSLTNGIPDRDKVIASLWTRALLSFNPDSCDDIDAPVHFMGMVHPEAENGGAAGYASTISKQSWVQLPAHTPNPIAPAWNAMREGSVMAQELAHNYGRKHVDCGNPDNLDNNYPYPPCQIANVGPASYYGFDPASLRPIRPDETADFMSYARRSWVSDYTWRALLNATRTSALAVAPQAELAQGNSIFVTGLVDASEPRGAITVLLGMPAASLPAATLATLRNQEAQLAHSGTHQTGYSLRLRGPDGAVLLERPLTLTPLDDHVADGDSALFSDLFPQPAGPVTTIELLAEGTVVDTRIPGRAAPQATIQQPGSGVVISDTLNLEWTATDADRADRLLTTVQYSADNGVRWHTLALNVPQAGEARNRLNLRDLGSISGSAPNQARIRLLVSDGYNTTIATSPPFTVANRPPEPFIAVPGPGQVFAAGEPIPLHGGALDPEDGGLRGSRLQWRVGGSAQGVGVTNMALGLAPGQHTVTISATDVLNQTRAATTQLRILPLSVPLTTAPTLDGVCSDPAYAGANRLQLQPYAGGAQGNILFMRSADQLWICFDGLAKGATVQGSQVGVRGDLNNSRDPLAQAGDVGFFVGEDGAVFTQIGDGSGGFTPGGPGGLAGQVAAGESTWSAELRINRATLGDWGQRIGLSFEHTRVAAGTDAYRWPYSAAANRPNSWAETLLGDQPVISAIEPFSLPAGSPAQSVAISGSGFTEGVAVLWNGAALPTTRVNDRELTVELGANLLSSVITAQISVRNSGNATSNALPFVVSAAAPQISGLSPTAIGAGSSRLNLTVTGSNFAPGAQVVWDGELLQTQFVSAGELRAQVRAALLSVGQSVGVRVRNPAPSPRNSALRSFTITARPFQVYTPVVRR